MAEFEHKEELVVGLYDRGALLFGDFPWVLKSGRRSPLYYNQRPITSFDHNSTLSLDAQRRIRDLAIDGYSNAIDDGRFPYRHLYGIPQSLTALGAMVALSRGDSMLWGRVGGKEYGAHNDLEGNYSVGESVKVLDDVITNAKSKLETVDDLERVDLTVSGFVVMFDREEGGAQKVNDAGYELLSVAGLASAMDILREANRIGQQEFDWIAQYHEDLRAHDLM